MKIKRSDKKLKSKIKNKSPSIEQISKVEQEDPIIKFYLDDSLSNKKIDNILMAVFKQRGNEISFEADKTKIKVKIFLKGKYNTIQKSFSFKEFYSLMTSYIKGKKKGQQ